MITDVENLSIHIFNQVLQQSTWESCQKGTVSKESKPVAGKNTSKENSPKAI